MGKEDNRPHIREEASFSSRLRQIEGANYEERINSLVQRIDEQGKILAQKVDIKELKIYKRLLAEFLDEVLNDSLKFSKESILDRRGRHKVYALVKKINKEVEKLTSDVLSQEKNNIRILQRLDDIRGLIMDILM